MDKIITRIICIFFLLGVSGCSLIGEENNEIIQLQETIKIQQEEIQRLEKKNELKEKIEKIKNAAYKQQKEKLRQEIQNLKSKNSISGVSPKFEFEKEKELDVNFYSQFPLDIATGKKYEEPYQNFCEEASLLNGYYYHTGKKPDINAYHKDLLELQHIEDLLFEGGYMHTNIEDTLKLLIAFQGDKQEVLGNIIENPTEEDIKYNISLGNTVLVPVYGKGLSNHLFNNGGPVYHNVLIKGYTENNFIVNEVGVTKGDGYNYKIDELMQNIADYDKALYPNNFLQGKKKILILYK